MPGRQTTNNQYRYGFNGKENDKETVGTGQGTQDYGMRIYNPSLGKFLSVDPLSKKFAWYTPYQFSGNRPIWAIDLDGAEELPTNNGPNPLPTVNGQTGPYSQEYINEMSGKGNNPVMYGPPSPATDKPDFRVSAGGPLPYPLNFTSNFGFAFYKTLSHNCGDDFYDYNSLAEYWNVWGRQDEPSSNYRPAEFSIQNSNGSWNTLSITMYHYKQHVSNVFHPAGGLNEISLNYTYESKMLGEGMFSKHLNFFAGGGFGFIATDPTVHGPYDKTHTASQVGPRLFGGYEIAGKGGSAHLGLMYSFKIYKNFNMGIYAMGQMHAMDTRNFSVVENSTGNVVYNQDIRSFGIGGSFGTRVTYNITR